MMSSDSKQNKLVMKQQKYKNNNNYVNFSSYCFGNYYKSEK